MISAHLPALQVVLPLLGAVVCAFLKRGSWAWLVALAVSLVLPAIALGLLYQTYEGGTISYALGGWRPPFGIEYRVDIFNAFVLVLVSVIGAVIMPYAKRSVEHEIPEDKQAWFYAIYLLCLCGLLGIAITGDAFNAFVFMEISSLATYALIAMGRDRRALLAAYQYLIMGTIGATFYVIGVGLLYSMTGTLNLADMANRLAGIEDSRAVLAALAFLTVGISLKLALFPLHVWLPNAYAYAPSMATVFLSATATKVAVYLLLRYFFSVFGVSVIYADLPVSWIFLVLSIAAMFGASLVAVFQANIKRMLAYSSVAQIGYITLGIAIANKTGLAGGIVHLFNHAIMKAALFMALGSIFFRIGSVRIEDLAGIAKRMPVTAGVFVVGGLGLIGVPGTAGFISKWYLGLGAIENGWWWLLMLIVLSSAIAVLYVGRVVEVMWFREPSPVAKKAEEPPLSMLLPTLLLTFATIYFGFDTFLTAHMADLAAQLLLTGGR
ncbi:MAG: monovalent cation/H+ antiporter subunit D family protein [Hyphomicrobiaceae bacterium]|nr:monovalent cation/H+ antiporter subunit D family protein [Hyphomicrobiaceae bacterium]